MTITRTADGRWELRTRYARSCQPVRCISWSAYGRGWSRTAGVTSPTAPANPQRPSSAPTRRHASAGRARELQSEAVALEPAGEDPLAALDPILL